MYKKIQTANSILSAFSKALNLAHILKISVSTLAYEQARRPGKPAGHSVALSACSQGTFLFSLLCITAFSVPYEGLAE